jgi:membrane-bound lytic murein transglycosylase B
VGDLVSVAVLTHQKDELAASVSPQTINAAFAGLSADQTVLAFDRRQRGIYHSKSFEDYARTRVISAYLIKATRLMAQHPAT